MRKANQLIKRSIVGSGLIALMVVLFPDQAKPLWEWAQSIGDGVGYDPLPEFSSGQGFARLIVLALSLAGIVYNAWRDRRFEVLQAEYESGTGAKHTKQKLKELEKQLQTVSNERTEWQTAHAELNKTLTDTLIAAKEHEIHRQYGEEDRQTLRRIRVELGELLEQKGHIEGFREAMQTLMVNFSESQPEVTSTAAHQPSDSTRPNGRKRLGMGI
ncbi:MAG: hypothetical protein ACFCD0_05175 [Gemmataceae bacterium]